MFGYDFTVGDKDKKMENGGQVPQYIEFSQGQGFVIASDAYS